MECCLCVDDPYGWEIFQKIQSAFKDDLLSSQLSGLIQFWAPTEKESASWILSTSDQPFALEQNESCIEYRLCCTRYQYCIDDVNNKLQIEEDSMGISSAPAIAFLNRLPVVLNMRLHQGSPLARAAMKCEITSSLFLPVFWPSQSYNCVGVVECAVRSSSLLLIFNKLKSALRIAGLSTFHVQKCLPHKTIWGFKRVTHEVKEALETVCKSHALTLGQVWISYQNENFVPFSYSLQERDTRMKQMFAVKVAGYHLLSEDDDRLSIIKDYYDTCTMLPSKIGDGIAGKTLQTYEPHFCRNIFELTDNGLLALLRSTNTKCSCLELCLRSIDTGDVDYAFEFLWTQNRNYIILLESLLLTLKSCLPSFQFASGAQLGDDLRLVDVENSTGSGTGYLKIFDRNRISPIPKALEERGLVFDDSISSAEMKYNRVAEPQASESQRESSKKEEHPFGFHIVGPNQYWFQGDSRQEEDSSSKSMTYPGNARNELVLKVEYGDHRTLSFHPNSLKLLDINKHIEEKYNLGTVSYKLQFLDSENEWLRIDDENDWEYCKMHHIKTRAQSILLRVLPFTSLMLCN